MSRIMDAELDAAIEDLVARGDIEADSDAYGIAQQLIHRGFDTLSPAQWDVYDKVVVPALKRRETELLVRQRAY